MGTLELLQHLHTALPFMQASASVMYGYIVVSITVDGDEITDPIEYEHRGMVGDFGYPGLTEDLAKLISDHNADYITACIS